MSAEDKSAEHPDMSIFLKRSAVQCMSSTAASSSVMEAVLVQLPSISCSRTSDSQAMSVRTVSTAIVGVIDRP